MLHPLQERVATVQRRVRRLTWSFVWGRFAAASLGVILLASLADYLLRPQDTGLRVILSLGLIGILGCLFYRLVYRSRGSTPSLIRVAQRIERRNPQLGERLSSAMAFLAQTQDDPTAGSADLRRAVVAQAESLAMDLDFGDAIDARVPRRALWQLGVVVAVMGGILLLMPHLAILGLSRLAMPWGNQQWPARHHLTIAEAPQTIAAGDSFEVEITDAEGKLPEIVWIQLRHQANGSSRTQTQEMKLLGERMVFRLDNVTQPLEYRVYGGDDQTMKWQHLAVVTPPKVTELAVEILPPPYTGLGLEKVGKLARALAGSTIRVRGKTDKPILSAVLRSDGEIPQNVVVSIASGGRSFSLPQEGGNPWHTQKSGVYWFEVADDEKLPGGRDMRLELAVVPDVPPVISWETPGDHAFVTPRAIVPVKCLVKDDYAVHCVRLKYLKPDASDQGEFSVDLYVGPAKVQPASKTQPAAGDDSRLIEVAWDLAAIPGLQVGQVLAVRVTAEDYKPQEATTSLRRITIISDEELENRVTQKQTAILAQLAEVLRLQRDARAQSAALVIQFKETAKLTPQDLNHLQSAELNQRNVQRLLSDPQDGIETQLIGLIAELDNNRIGDLAVGRRMTELLEQVRQLNRQPLPLITRELTAAVKSARAKAEAENTPQSQCADDLATTTQSLEAAGVQQDEVVSRLETILGELSQWDSFSRLAREVGQIRQEQQKLAEETDALRLQGVTTQESTVAEQRATAKRLAQVQLELARRFDKLQTRMEDLLARLQQSDPQVAATLADALEAGRRLAIGGQMRTAATDLGEQKLGPSGESQQVALQGLAELLDLLSQRRDQELARDVKSLADADSVLKDLSQQQKKLQAQLDAAASNGDDEAKKRELQRLTKELEQLAQEVEELSRKLQRLQAQKPAQAGNQAASALGKAGDAAAQGNGEEAQKQSRRAGDLLEEARRQLQEQIQQAQQDLEMEQLARISQLVQGLVVRQKGVLAETARLDGLRSAQGGELPPAQRASLKLLAGEQRTLADETGQLMTSFASAKAFVFGLEGAEREMRRAASMLQKEETALTVRQAEGAALQRLEELLAALQADEPPPAEDPPPEQPPPGGQGGPRPPTQQNLAELKLLKLMQERIQARTGDLEKLRQKAGQLAPSELDELAGLAVEQGKLADMVVDMIRAAAEAPEDVLENLPNPGDNPPAEDDNGGESKTNQNKSDAADPQDPKKEGAP